MLKGGRRNYTKLPAWPWARMPQRRWNRDPD